MWCVLQWEGVHRGTCCSCDQGRMLLMQSGAHAADVIALRCNTKQQLSQGPSVQGHMHAHVSSLDPNQ